MRKKVLTLLMVFSLQSVIGQKVEYNNSVQDFITKSTPQAYQFQKYGDLPVNVNTGVADVSIPMFSVGIKNVDWKVGISYHSGGIKVNELSGCVGIGWNLNAAGMISSRNYQRSDVFMENQGDVTTNKRTFNLTPTTPNTGELHLCHYANTADMGFASNVLEMKQNGVGMNFIPDIFYLNAGGINAKFFLKNHKGYCMPSKDILIDHLPGSAVDEPSDNSQPGSWVVTDENGTKYTFEWGGANASESMWENNTPDGPGGTSPLAFNNYNPTFVVTKVENTLGEKIFFYYTKEYYFYKGNNSDVYHENVPTQTPESCQNPIDGFLATQHKSVYNYVIESRLDSIFSTSGQSVVFNYDARQDLPGTSKLTKVSEYHRTLSSYQFVKSFDLQSGYFGTGTDPRDLRLKLNSVVEKSAANQSGGQYSFEYNSTPLPSRISPAQDAYGYYNGKDDNQNLVPGFGGDRSVSFTHTKAGVLEKVNYPTGGYTILVYEPKLYGGLRIKSKTDFSLTQGYNYKEYGYGSVYFASGPGSGTPKFTKEINNYYLACAQTPNGIPPSQINCPAIQTYSEPIKTLYESYYGIDNTERYSSVTENYGLNGANGYTVYVFNSFDPLLNTEPGRLGTEDLLLSKTEYKKDGTNFVQIAKEDNFYSVLSEGSSGLFSNSSNPREARSWGLDFEQEKEEQIGTCPTPSGGGSSYAMCYPAQIFQVSIRLVSSPIMQYKKVSSLDNLITTKEFEYDANVILSPKTIKSYDSKSGRIVEKIKYPTDYTGITSADPVSVGIKNLLDKHIISTPIEKSTYRENANGSNSRLIGSTFTTYKASLPLPDKIYAIETNAGLTDFVPSSVQSGAVVKDSRYAEKVSFNIYNQFNELVELQKTGDIKSAYVWGEESSDLLGNKYRIPIASVTNAPQNEIAATSFELPFSIFYPITGAGNWSFTGSPVPDNSSPTGKKGYAISNGAISKAGLNSAATYLVTYWSKNGPQNVNGTSATSGRTFNGWTYYEHKVINPAGGNVTVSGSGMIDELRLYPQGAFMTSFTFDPLIGMTSQCDQNNRITYYEYDGFNRLSIIRDQDNNIIKKICYNFAGQPENCAASCTNNTANWQNTSTALRCQQGSCGNNGYQEQEQRDINPCSPTYNQTQWIVAGYNPTACTPSGTSPNWQNTSTALRCQQGSCGNTGYQEQEQQDMNPCSPTYNQTQWILAGYNPTACTPVSGVTITYQNNISTTGFTAVYTHNGTGQTYTFSIPAGSGTLGCIPAGIYNLTISKPGNSMLILFSCGCRTASGTSATFGKIAVSTTTCNTITLDYDY